MEAPPKSAYRFLREFIGRERNLEFVILPQVARLDCAINLDVVGIPLRLQFKDRTVYQLFHHSRRSVSVKGPGGLRCSSMLIHPGVCHDETERGKLTRRV